MDRTWSACLSAQGRAAAEAAFALGATHPPDADADPDVEPAVRS
ncbi:hypothetical protein [Streptomyces xanthophaeus]|nr:hypothetical protein [Streptomyces xanthophaeus]